MVTCCPQLDTVIGNLLFAAGNVAAGSPPPAQLASVTQLAIISTIDVPWRCMAYPFSILVSRRSSRRSAPGSLGHYATQGPPIR